MAAALQDLSSMQVTASDLKHQIMTVDGNMNQVGRAYLRHMLDSQDHSTMLYSLKLSQQVCELVVDIVMQTCTAYMPVNSEPAAQWLHAW